LVKKAGLSKADCKDEDKRRKAVWEYAKKNKGNVAEANVSAVIDSTGTDGDVVYTQSNEASASFVFYIARNTEWMINSGATEHITSYHSDFTSYLPFKSTCMVTLADQVT
jgi:hypothetical protein